MVLVSASSAATADEGRAAARGINIPTASKATAQMFFIPSLPYFIVFFGALAGVAAGADGSNSANNFPPPPPQRQCGEIGDRETDTTNTAQLIAREFQQLFGIEIREYDTSSSSDKKKKDKANIALWHNAISSLDIPDEDNESHSSLFKMKRLLSSVVVEIGNAAYPDPFNTNDPNHDWEGRAGGRKRVKNRAYHDSLNHMRQGASTLHFVHLVKLYRPDLWGRILRARNIDVDSEDERLYLVNIFVAGYMNCILRYNELRDDFYVMTEEAEKKFLQRLSLKESLPELVCHNSPVRLATAWFFQRLAQTKYYKSLLGKYFEHMVQGAFLINRVEGKFTDERGNICKAIAFLHDENGNEFNLDTVAEDILAAHFEMAVLWTGHYIDHVRMDFSHFTKPVRCHSFFFSQMCDKFFGEQMMQRIKELYSFWTYLTQQAGIIVASEDGDAVFNGMKAPNEIKMETGKTFFESNPWAGSLQESESALTIIGTWLHVMKYPPVDDAQMNFHALCKDFDKFFHSTFAAEYLNMYLDVDTANFFIDVFQLRMEDNSDCLQYGRVTPSDYGTIGEL